MKPFRSIGLLLATLALAAPARGESAPSELLADAPIPVASPAPEAPASDGSGAADPATSIRQSESSASSDDPFEPFNRAMFTFNEKVDDWVLEPVARGWDFVLPRPAERGISNFFENLRSPVQFLSNILQGKLDPAAITLCRFVVNTTVGIGGLLDVATDLELPVQRADFGQTLGVWGVPAGPYIVWPILGSSSPRDTVGVVGDGYAGIQSLFIDFYILAGFYVINTVNSRALALDTVDNARAASLDFYVAARDAYVSQREARVRGTTAPDPARERDLYFPEFTDSEVVP